MTAKEVTSALKYKNPVKISKVITRIFTEWLKHELRHNTKGKCSKKKKL